ncbi:uncharacterized protein LOC108949982 [Ciona intestinalis]
MCYLHRWNNRTGGSIKYQSSCAQIKNIALVYRSLFFYFLIVLISLTMCADGTRVEYMSKPETVRIAVMDLAERRYLCLHRQMMYYTVKACRNETLSDPNVYAKFNISGKETRGAFNTSHLKSGDQLVLSVTLDNGKKLNLAWSDRRLIAYDFSRDDIVIQLDKYFLVESDGSRNGNTSSHQDNGLFRLYSNARSCNAFYDKPRVTYVGVKRVGSVFLHKVRRVPTRGGGDYHCGGNAQIRVCKQCRDEQNETRELRAHWKEKCLELRRTCNVPPSRDDIVRFNKNTALFRVEPYR